MVNLTNEPRQSGGVFRHTCVAMKRHADSFPSEEETQTAGGRIMARKRRETPLGGVDVHGHSHH